MFPLLLRTLLMFNIFCLPSSFVLSFFFLVEQFLFPNTVFFSFSKTFVVHSVASFIFFFHLSLWNSFSFSSPFCSSFFLFAFFSLVLSQNCSIALNKKHALLISPKLFLWSSFCLFFEMFQKLFYHHLWHFHFFKQKGFERLGKVFFFFYFCSFWWNLVSFFEKWAIPKKIKKKHPDLFFGNPWRFQQKTFFRKTRCFRHYTPKKIERKKKELNKKERRRRERKQIKNCRKKGFLNMRWKKRR